MDVLIKNALTWFSDNWDVPICGTTDAARVLGMKANTLRTRVQRGQAVATRTPGDVRDTIEFTGQQVTYNMFQHVFSRFSIPIKDLETGACPEIIKWCDKIKIEVLTKPFIGNGVARYVVQEEDRVGRHYYTDGSVIDTSGEPALIIPVGAMVIRIAVDLWMRSSPRIQVAGGE